VEVVVAKDKLILALPIIAAMVEEFAVMLKFSKMLLANLLVGQPVIAILMPYALHKTMLLHLQ